MKNYFKILLIIISLFFSFSFAGAMETFLDAEIQEIGIGDQFETEFFLNTEDKSINAIEGEIIFPTDLLELKEIRDGSTIISLWIERPRLEFGNRIVFSGIVPGGYQGNRGFIFSMVFQTKKQGQGLIEISNARTLLNDGKGTEADLNISDFPFAISEEIPASGLIRQIIDNDPPEPFKLEVTRDPTVFEGRWFLVFATQDKGIGIDHYEISESSQKYSFRSLIEKEIWQIGESPYLLKDQDLKSHISVKAVDKSGNERLETLLPQNPLAWYENYLIWGKIIISIVIVLAIVCLIWKLRNFYEGKL